MRNTRPKFSQERYNKFDNVAKQAAYKYLKKQYPESAIHIPEENYKEDLIICFPYKKYEFFFIQAEIRDCWKGSSFPYPTLQLPASKFDNALSEEASTWFMVFNHDLSTVALLRANKDTPKTLVQHTTRLQPDKLESFYEFELSHVIFEQVF